MDNREMLNLKKVENALEIINELTPLTYTNKYTGHQEIGLSGQELLNKYPLLVGKTLGGMYVVDYEKLTVLLLSALHDLQEKLKINNNLKYKPKK